jgi:hypothetical protein
MTLIWDESDNQAISNPQSISYQDAKGNELALPPVQFMATSALSPFGEWYPILYAYVGKKIVMMGTFRIRKSQKEALNFAKEKVEQAIRGTAENEQADYWQLNVWAYEIARNLELIEIGT